MRVVRVTVAALALAAAVVVVAAAEPGLSGDTMPPPSMGTDGSAKEAPVAVPALASSPAPAPAPPLTPVEIAVEDAFETLLPSPVIETNPSPSTFVNLASWLWIDPIVWEPVAEAVTVPGPSTIVVTAVPVQVLWSMGDGSTVACPGPGEAYDPRIGPEQQHTDCSYTYRFSSAGQPSVTGQPNDDSFTVRATVVWLVSWSSAPNGGVDVDTSAQSTLRVEQIESVGSTS